MKYISSSNLTKGFSLFEIIVVLVILGVLTTLAAGSYFNWIKKATAAEAIIQMKHFKDQVELCKISKPDIQSQQICANQAVHGKTSENFLYDVYHAFDFSYYMIVATKRTSDPEGTTISPLCEGAPNEYADPQSGIQLCHHTSGAEDLMGFGTYQGSY